MKDTIIRTIIAGIVILNGILTAAGKNPLPFSDDEIFAGVTAIVTAAATIWVWWKNNSITKDAIKADELLKALKKGEIDDEQSV